MVEIGDVRELTLDSSRNFCYGGKRLGNGWGVTLYHFDEKVNKLEFENFSLLALFLHFVGYKESFNQSGLAKWLRWVKEDRSSSSKVVSKVAIGRLLSAADPRESEKLEVYRNFLKKHPFGQDPLLIDLIEKENIDVNALVDEKSNETLLIEACTHGRFCLAKYLIGNGAEVDGALHGAIAYGNGEVVELLLKKGANIEQGNRYGETPLLAAIRRLQEKPEDRANGIALIKTLVEKRANVERKVKLKGSPPVRPLQRAIDFLKEEEALEIAVLLAQHGAPVDPEGEGKEYVLHAIYGSKLSVVGFLLDEGVDLKSEKVPSRGDTPFTAALAVIKKKKEFLIRLLHAKGADLNQAALHLLQTPLHMAVEMEDLEMVKLLLDLGADKACENRNGKLPIDLARIKERVEIVRLLER